MSTGTASTLPSLSTTLTGASGSGASASSATTTATATATTSATPRRPPPLPAVKGTMGGIETPKRDIWSPGEHKSDAQLRSAPPSPTPTATDPGTGTVTEPAPAAPEVTFRADPRLRTCFEGLPEGGEEVMKLFGV